MNLSPSSCKYWPYLWEICSSPDSSVSSSHFCRCACSPFFFFDFLVMFLVRSAALWNADSRAAITREVSRGVAIAVVAVGFWRDWFTVETTKEDGKTHVDLTVNKEKFKQDKEKLKAQAAEKSRAMKEKIAGLREKSKGLSGEEKAKADKEIDELSKKHESLEGKLKDLDEAGEDKFEELKRGITSAIEEHTPSTGK